jgi:hypothetical protein
LLQARYLIPTAQYLVLEIPKILTRPKLTLDPVPLAKTVLTVRLDLPDKTVPMVRQDLKVLPDLKVLLGQMEALLHQTTQRMARLWFALGLVILTSRFL